MKANLLLLPVLALSLLLGACNSAERYKKNQGATDEGLAQFTLPARVNIAGTWTSNDWGAAMFSQSGRVVSGQLGGYEVRGVVSGSTAYLAVMEAGWTYYTVKLTQPSSGKLTGTYSTSIPYSERNSRVILLQRF
jgi:hypothetical protein